MIRNRVKKVLLASLLTAVLAGWGALAFVPAAMAGGEDSACTNNDECDWPLSCRGNKCVRVSTFRLVPECATVRSPIPGKAPEVPTVTCMLETFGRIAQLILGLTGSAALLMFVYGGFLMVISAGSQEKVTKGKTVMTNAVIGILIIMTSGLLIQYGMSKIGISEEFKVIGQTCNNGKGVQVQMPNGKNQCVTDCKTDLGKSGFDCVDTKGAGAGKYCIANLCKVNTEGKTPEQIKADPNLSRDFMCCYIK